MSPDESSAENAQIEQVLKYERLKDALAHIENEHQVAVEAALTTLWHTAILLLLSGAITAWTILPFLTNTPTARIIIIAIFLASFIIVAIYVGQRLWLIERRYSREFGLLAIEENESEYERRVSKA